MILKPVFIKACSLIINKYLNSLIPLISQQKHQINKAEDVQALLGIDNKRSYLPITAVSTASMSDRSSIHSSMSSSYSDLFPSGGENPDLDLSGLVESTVDSDDEESSETGVSGVIFSCLSF